MLSQRLRLYAADAAGELDVFDHHGHALRMDSAEVGVLKQMYHVKLARLLERKERIGLPSLLAVRRRRVIRLRDFSHLASRGRCRCGAVALTPVGAAAVRGAAQAARCHAGSASRRAPAERTAAF